MMPNAGQSTANNKGFSNNGITIKWLQDKDDCKNTKQQGCIIQLRLFSGTADLYYHYW